MQQIAVEKKIPELVAAERLHQQVKVLRPTLDPKTVTEPQPVQPVQK